MERRGRTVFDGINLLWAALFLVSAALQLNDPDPLRWILIYASAASACLVHRVAPRAWLPPAIVGLAALTWAGLDAPRVLPGLRFGDLFRSMKAETPSIEESRELLGLLIVAGWMAVLVLRTRRRTRAS
jgi:hypothetical protein